MVARNRQGLGRLLNDGEDRTLPGHKLLCLVTENIRNCWKCSCCYQFKPQLQFMWNVFIHSSNMFILCTYMKTLCMIIWCVNMNDSNKTGFDVFLVDCLQHIVAFHFNGTPLRCFSRVCCWVSKAYASHGNICGICAFSLSWGCVSLTRQTKEWRQDLKHRQFLEFYKSLIFHFESQHEKLCKSVLSKRCWSHHVGWCSRLISWDLSFVNVPS